MAYAPVPNPGSCLDRAICAYLKTEWSGAPPQILPANTNPDVTREPNVLTVQSHSSTHAIPLSDVEEISVQITLAYPATRTPDDPDPELYRAEFDRQVGVLRAILLQTATPHQGLTIAATGITASGVALSLSDGTTEGAVFAGHNADMAGFELRTLQFAGCSRGKADPESNSWFEMLNFRARVKVR